ncbi:MAG: HAMP domain-containing sensor histidine kinase, partial [Gemmatimonadaceae bacterium]
AERIGRIVEDLLMLARADAGERPIERQRVFLDDIVADAVEAARTLATLKKVSVEVREFVEAAVTGDATLLRQLVLILLDNAIKFTPESGAVLVDVGASNGSAILTVEDNGIGISEEQLPQVFDRFFRGDAARTRGTGGASPGAGLGLSIAEWIAREHGASVRVTSHLGQGTRVVVNFPVAITDAM